MLKINILEIVLIVYLISIYIDCVEVEISPDNWIMAVDINNIDLIKLDINYNIQWKECSCLKGIRLEDVAVELEKEAYEEIY